jgi:hypothetical protein
MAATTIPDYPRGLTFEQVWAALMENREQMKETDRKFQETDRKFQETDRKFQETDRKFQETDRLIKENAESQKETDRLIKETREDMKVTDRLIKELSLNVGGLNRSMGELIETLIAARLWEKFADYPYNFQRTYRRIPIYDENNKELTEVDILLSNTEWAMVVEVKREPDKDDINHHIKRMERVCKYPPAEAKGKKLLAAIAGGAVDQDVKDYALAAGFFMLELKGESVTLIPPPEGFEPKTYLP